ncbi:uncharacterized protein LY89DRAFT_727825 [Mollisia scopiformis]|uniref:Uncharacterized protein n=1 Tax=Mollisia scopiformis TaxID=149040 RepID=A0A194XSC2_MOLSC|nr:uncharacterized protein LY89DRAFT_727825 [Mollisia scopiformis]KUJ23041.1 hypothetical protein LY89DRAFT_727825 [Mollisia scopiformis]
MDATAQEDIRAQFHRIPVQRKLELLTVFLTGCFIYLYCLMKMLNTIPAIKRNPFFFRLVIAVGIFARWFNNPTMYGWVLGFEEGHPGDLLFFLLVIFSLLLHLLKSWAVIHAMMHWESLPGRLFVMYVWFFRPFKYII